MKYYVQSLRKLVSNGLVYNITQVKTAPYRIDSNFYLEIAVMLFRWELSRIVELFDGLFFYNEAISKQTEKS